MRTRLKRTLCGAALLLGGLTAHAQGLQGIIVEDYYTISAADATYINGGSISTPITAGTKVYRIYVDMAPGYKLNTVNGSPASGGVSPNPLIFSTTTSFWNDDNFGTEVPPQTARLDERAAFDSYITIGVTGRSGGTAGCGASTQQQGTLKTADTNGNLTLCSVYSGFPSGAGTPDGNIPTSPAIPALTYNLGGLIDFTALQTGGDSLVVVGDAWATLPNGTGVDPTGTNRVLIAQLTTDGALSFKLNVQLQQPTGGVLETYVWNQAGAGEVVSPLLVYPGPDCLGVIGGPAVPGSSCNDNNACTSDDVYDLSCACVGSFPAANYDFASSSATTNTITNTTIGALSLGNNNGTTTLITSTSASSGYVGASGTNNAGAAAFIGALNTATSTYFEVTVTPNPGNIFTLNALNFGTRSTGTGPQAYSVRTSANGFATDVATGAIANSSAWAFKTNGGLNVASGNGAPLTIRIYGHSGTGSPSAGTANWRIDDLSVQGCNTVVPCVPASITTATSNSPICATATLNLNATATGDAPLSFVWSGVGTISNGNTASASVTGAATGLYTVIVTNACGADTQTVNVTVDAVLTYYADVDGDGFGDPAVDSLACAQPVGYVSNSTDNCPAVSGVIGSTCNDGNPNTANDVLNASCVCEGTPVVTFTGCSSSQSPYLLPVGAGRTTTSILTVGDLVGGYDLVGIPDGMGAYDNGNGTFTLLVNHELGATQGIARAHGSIGSFVSEWVINKNDLCVQSGGDLIQSVQLWNGTGFATGTTAFGRFCSADLPEVSAFYNAGTGKGTQTRIFMNGEESGAEGRAFGHIATGANKGVSYQLPYLGRFSWENSVASPASGDKTVVVGLDDATTNGQVYVYIGTKQSTGNDIEKAGLNNGKLFGVKVTGLASELNASIPAANTPFTLFDQGFVPNTTGAALNSASVANGVTNFQRPEDGHWDPSNPNDFYFLTTASFTTNSRLWRLRFTDILQPELGGTITAVLEGPEGQKMMDNMTVDTYGQAVIQEDPGNQSYLARIRKYDIATDGFVEVATHDAARFVIGGANYLTQDEETSGIIDMKDILGKGRYLVNVQAHYAIPGELVEGGQLLDFSTGDTTNACIAPTLAAISSAQSLCSDDTLALNTAFNGTPGLSYSWSGTGSFLFGTGNASALVTGAASGIYTVTVTNECGSAQGTVNVTVNPTTNDTTTISACDTYTWSVNNQVYTASGTYTNVAGCDTDVLVLTITPSTGSSLTASACDSYTWTANNQTYTASGTYTNTVGCNTDTLVLTINQSSGSSLTVSACDSYTWTANNQTYTVSGTYTNVNACNTDTLVLTITPSTGGSLTASACDSYTWTANNQTYTASGTYTNTVGCNTDTLVLTINQSSGSSLTVSACDSYTWTANNQTYTVTGTYTNVNACNTDTLVLTITPSTGASLTVSACDSYTWTANNQTYTASGIYTNTVGCNTDTLVLTITPITGGSLTASACGSYTWTANNQTYTASGTYTNTVGCNTDTLVLTVSIPGTACNDGNANTINDVLNANCVCQGTPVAGCTQNEVTLTLTTDANAAQTSYDIVNIGTTTVVCSGTGYANNSVIPVTCCLPNGCYELRVFDSAGDGIVPGGYVLTNASGQRIIDNANDGAFGSVSQIAFNLGFCLPIGTDKVINAHCDVETWNRATGVIQAQVNPAVTAQFGVTNSTSGYQFWFYNPDGGYSRRIQQTHAAPGTVTGAPANQRASYLKLSSMVTSPLPNGTLLNVKVRALVAGTYAPFGPACRFRIAPITCQPTQLTTVANPAVSCGATVLPGATIHADAVAGATNYRFSFTRPGYARNAPSTTRSLVLGNWQTLPLLCGFTYTVTVAVSFDGGATYCPVGAPCQLTVACPAQAQQRDMGPVEQAPTALRMWPNPNNGEQLFLSLELPSNTETTATVDIHDLTGSRVMSHTLPLQGELLNTAIALDEQLAPGVYMVSLLAGDHLTTQRLVVQ